MKFFTVFATSALVFALTTINVFSQINEGGVPLTQTIIEKLHLNDVPVSIMPFVDTAQLMEEDRVFDTQRDRPFRFGENIDVDFSLDNSGVWDEIKDYRVWRLGIKSDGALSLNFLFDEYVLPEGAKLFIYSVDGNEILGAFTHRNNQADLMFATMLIHTDEVVIEYIEPKDVAFSGRLNLARVTHGYRHGSGKHGSFGSSGSCNLNVACDESLGWEDEIRSVARMVVNGNSWCTGSLINNTSNDGTPYFLSADHCFTNPGQIVFWFNYQSDTCANPASPPSHDAISGAVTIARNQPTDMWLLQLNHEPPSEYEVFYAGWNATMDASVDGLIVGIHHPSGDIKKFSYTNDGVTTSNYLGGTGSGTTHWRVGFWEGGTTTEPGSSGSAIFDANGRILGQLHGGYAACGNTREDWYGKLGVSWTGGGSPNSRLSDWLDPLGTGDLTWDGYDPNIASVDVDAQMSGINSPRGSYLVGEEIAPSVTIRNAGINDLTDATIEYGVVDEFTETYTWSGLLETAQREQIQFDAFELPAGTYDFFATITVPGDENPDNDTATSSFTVIDCTQTPQLPYLQDFDTPGAIECWQITDNIGNGQVWSVGNIGSRGISDNSSNYAYLDSDAFGSGNSQDSDLITPAFNFSNYDEIEVSFIHYFRQFQTSVASFSYSIDGGDTWELIESWDETTANPAEFVQGLPQLTGEADVRFKWNFTGSWDWYWSVDDVQVTGVKTQSDPSYIVLMHQSPDDTLSSVSVWWNDEMLLDDLSFRTVSDEMEIADPQGGVLSIRSNDGEIVFHSHEMTTVENEKHEFLLIGLTEPDEHAPNPDGNDTGVTLIATNGMDDVLEEDEVYVWLMNASTDLAAIKVETYDNHILVDDLSYGEMSEDYSVISSDAHFITISTQYGFNEVFELDVSTLGGSNVILAASGFANNEEGILNYGFSMVVITEEGDVIELRNATSAGDTDSQLPVEFTLEQNYPNPFNPTTLISYTLPTDAHVTLEVYSVTGQRVAVLQNGTQQQGVHTVSFDASRLSSGVYIYRIQAGAYTQSRKMLLIK